MTYLRKWQLQQLKPLLQCSKLVAGFPAGSWQSHIVIQSLLFLGVKVFCRSTRHMTAQTDSLRSPQSDILPALKRPSLKSRSGIYLCGSPRRSKKIVEVVEELPCVSSPSPSRLYLPACISLPVSPSFQELFSMHPKS
jgi:hypothetical protein